MDPIFVLTSFLLSISPGTDPATTGARIAETLSEPATCWHWGHYDGDGLADLLVLDAHGAPRLFRNGGDGSFTERTVEAGLNAMGATRTVAWGDFDRDGSADLFLATDEGPRLMRNDGAGGFFDATLESGLARVGGLELFARAIDFDADGFVDLHVVTSAGDRLLHNRSGRFEEVSLPSAALLSVVGSTLVPEAEEVPQPAPRAGAPDPSLNGRRPVLVPTLGEGIGPRTDAGPVGPGATPSGPFTQLSVCAPSVADDAGGCLQASSVPTLGMLFPLGLDLNVAVTGEVGVGTTAPSHRLTVASATDDALRLIGPNAFGHAARLNFGDGDYVYLQEDEDDKLAIFAAQRTAILGGDVGIGTSAPAAKLDVRATAGTGLRADSPDGVGIVGDSHAGVAVPGFPPYAGVYGRNDGGGDGVQGWSDGGGSGVRGYTYDPIGLGGFFENYAAGTGLLVRGQGQTRSNAALRVQNDNPVQGMAAYLTNTSNFATAHLQNDGTGEVLWLDNQGQGPYIVATDGTSWDFWVEEDGKTNVQVLQIHGGADLSEPFDVAASASQPAPEPGMVVCIDSEEPGKLTVSSRSYDRTVAGVISGAGGVNPGVVMGQRETVADGEHPVALAGRVYVRCTAEDGAIRPGDLLTTSDLAGHARRVDEHARAQGAVLGKAMGALESGTGLVLVLVGLQ